jgi:Ca-activated chloride channel family protein
MGELATQDKADYYALLGVTADATLDEIKSAYRALARRYHPDSGGDAAAAELFQRITTAYETIGDERRRDEYDAWRREQGLVAEPPLRLGWTLSRSELPILLESQVLYVLLELRASAELQQARAPLNLCLVIDRSTSMQGRRMDQVKAAATRIIDELLPEDRLAIVSFSDRAEVVLPASERLDKGLARSRVINIQPAGGTEILSGLVAALSEVVQTRHLRGVNHVILLTDGRTYGDEAESLALAEEAGADGLGISAMGIGHDWNDHFLDLLASKTGGSSSYIESPDKVSQFLSQRILGLGAARATDLRLYVHPASGTQLRHAFKLSPFAQELTVPGEGPILLGALEGDEPLTLMLEFHIGPQSEEGPQSLVEFDMRATLAGQGARVEHVSRRLKAAFRREPREETPPAAVVAALGKLTVHRMQERAYQAVERGDTEGATRSLETLATRLMALGHSELAQAALAEADRLTRTGRLSGEGRMRLKYGTRSLLGLPAPKVGS